MDLHPSTNRPVFHRPGPRRAGAPHTPQSPSDPQAPRSTRLLGAVRERLARLTASTTAGGVMLVGLPFALEYVVRPGDTLSEIAVKNGTSVEALVERNDLHRSGDQVMAGETLDIPAAHGRSGATGSTGGDTGSTGAASGSGSDARRIMRYTVRPGDTPSELAVRYHAWTAEIIERNGSVLRAGEQIEIPVVVEAAAAARRTPASSGATSSTAGASRSAVRRTIEATAREYGVDPDLALAVSWQEAGWRMHHTSYAGAIGAMQVMPSTGRWMSDVVGRRLDLRSLHDNVTAGVALLDILLAQAPTRTAVAGYYQGLDGVRTHGMLRETRRYVANVMALRDRFAAGAYP